MQGKREQEIERERDRAAEAFDDDNDDDDRRVLPQNTCLRRCWAPPADDHALMTLLTRDLSSFLAITL